MPVEQALPSGHPIMVAWEKYKTGDEYANTRRWAIDKNHTEGSLWAAFLEGWKAAEKFIGVNDVPDAG